MSKQSQRGFSMVELVVGIGLAVLLFSVSLYLVSSMVRSTGSLNLRMKAAKKLSAVEEQLRFKSAASFDTMEETNADRTGNYDKHILVFSTVGPINPATRTRTVNLTAKYRAGPGPWNENTNVKTINRTFELAKVTAHLAGGAITVKVVEQVDGDPVQNVDVYVPGQSAPELSGRTGADGSCTIFGVLIATYPINVRLDGTNLFAYFPDVNSFIKSIPVPANEIHEGSIKDVGQHSIILPGRLLGQVQDITTTLGVENVGIVLYPVPGHVPPVVPLNDPAFDLTDSNGNFTFEHVIPCQSGFGDCYYPLVIGNSSYTAVDIPGTDSNMTIAYPQVLVVTNTDNVVNPPLRTILKGSVQGTLKSVVYTPGPGYIDNGNVVSGTQIDFYRVISWNSYCYHDNIWQNWNSSLAANDLWVNYSVNTSTAAADGNPVNITKRTFTPLIVNTIGGNPATHPFDQQGDQLYTYPDHDTLNQLYAPIMVRLGDLDHSVKFLLRIYGASNDSDTAPQPVSLNDFKIFPRTNDLANVNNTGHTWYYLGVNNQTFSNATGAIVEAVNGDFGDMNDIITYTVYTYWTPTSIDQYRGLGGLYFTGGQCRLYGGLTVNAVKDIPNRRFTFDFANGGQYPLIPNLEGELQHFGFYAETSLLTLSRNYEGTMIGYFKDALGAYQQAAPLNLSQLLIQFRYYQGNNNYPVEETLPEDITAGAYDFDRNSKYKNGWVAQTPWATLDPGQPHDFGDVNATPQPTTYRQYYLSVVPTLGIPWRHNYQLGTPYGVLHTYDVVQDKYLATTPIEVVMVGTRQIIGKVKDLNGSGLPNATVTLGGTGIGSNVDYPVDGNGFFNFVTPEADMAPGNNIWIRAVAPGYQQSNWIYEQVFFNNPPWGDNSGSGAADITLTPTGGGGGNQGQGGSG